MSEKKKALKSLVTFFKKTIDEYDAELVELKARQKTINDRIEITKTQRRKIYLMYEQRNKELNDNTGS